MSGKDKIVDELELEAELISCFHKIVMMYFVRFREHGKRLSYLEIVDFCEALIEKEGWEYFIDLHPQMSKFNKLNVLENIKTIRKDLE